MTDNLRQAGVMLIINQGMILGISRREDQTIFGLPGGKFDPDREPTPDKDTRDTAINETREETSVIVKQCEFIYRRDEPARYSGGLDFHTYCYYATSWEGTPTNSEEGLVKWLTAEELTSTKAAFPDYNRRTLNRFKELYPNVYIKGE